MDSDQQDIENYKRPGFLTKWDRDFLVNEPGEYVFEKHEGMEDNTKEQKRQRIRDRAHGAVQDFALLWKHLDKSDRVLIFETYADSWSFDSPRKDLIDMLSFIALGEAAHSGAYPDRRGGHHIRGFEGLISAALDSAYAELGLILESINFDVTSHDESEIEELKQKLRAVLEGEGDPHFDPNAIRILVAAGEIKMSSIRQLLEKELNQ